MRYLFSIILSLALLASCKQPLPPGPDSGKDPIDKPDTSQTPPAPPQQTLPTISEFRTTTVMVYQGLEIPLKVRGLKEGDSILLGDVKCDLVRSDDTEGAFFKAPMGMLGGDREVKVIASGSTVSLGKIYVDVTDGTDVKKDPSASVYGRVVDIDGNPIKGVSVSDGVLTSQTNDEGVYYLRSKKAIGYVFITPPKGYKPALKGAIPQFFRFLQAQPYEYEMCSFVLEKQTQDKVRVIVYTDPHIANRTDDVSQFTNAFKADLRNEKSRAESDGATLYMIGLGDLAWDEYWYVNKFAPADYAKLISDIGIPIYNIPGNHDNDPEIPDDFRATEKFRKAIGPTYYSVDLGDVHYILMDNTLFRNSGAGPSKYNVQDYSEGLTEDQFTWLANDIKYVDPSKRIVLGMHIQYTGRPKVGGGFSYAMPADQRQRIEGILGGRELTIISGHTHITYTNKISDKITEYNVGAVCGGWWWTGKYSSHQCNMCQDGAHSCYRVFDYQGGTAYTTYYKPIARSKDYVFRAYDLNNCLITRAKYCPKGTSISDDTFKQYANGYDTPRDDNAILINVFPWSKEWKVEAFEGSRKIELSQVEAYDPLYTVLFNMKRFNSNSSSMTFPAVKIAHMFTGTCISATSSVDIVVTDEFGTEYRQTLARPLSLETMVNNSSKY